MQLHSRNCELSAIFPHPWKTGALQTSLWLDRRSQLPNLYRYEVLPRLQADSARASPDWQCCMKWRYISQETSEYVLPLLIGRARLTAKTFPVNPTLWPIALWLTLPSVSLG